MPSELFEPTPPASFTVDVTADSRAKAIDKGWRYARAYFLVDDMLIRCVGEDADVEGLWLNGKVDGYRVRLRFVAVVP